MRPNPSVSLLFLLSIITASLGCNDATAVPDCTADMDAEVCAVFQLVNQERTSRGLDPYAWNAHLAVAAQRHAEDMVEQGYFDHVSLDGRSFVDRAEDAGYEGSPLGENIAWGQQSAEVVMDSWMNSPGHRNNILAPNSNEIGVGLYGNHWVQVFGRTELAP